MSDAPPVTGFVARRLAQSAVLLLLVLTVTFFVLLLAPGDPAQLALDPGLPPEHRDALRALWGLDRPLAAQYASWLGSALSGDWGYSYTHQQPVTRVIGRFIGPTLLLTGAALALQFACGLGLGVAAARRRGSLLDRSIRVSSAVLHSVPVFWLGLMALLVVSHAWGLAPGGHMRSVGAAELGPLARFGDLLHHLALPALVLGLPAAGATERFVRAQLLEALGQDYVRTARAKGLGENRVVWLHALRNALGPLVQLLGLSLPFLLSGALIVEVVFSWPGLGRLTYQAILARDYPLILAGTALSGALVVAGTLAADLGQAAVDPRVRRG